MMDLSVDITSAIQEVVEKKRIFHGKKQQNQE